MSFDIPNPPFESAITQTVFELERLRYFSLKGTTPKWLFFELKNIMQMLESLSSARIEGNRTTVMGVVESVIRSDALSEDEQIKEIANIQRAIDFIEERYTQSQVDGEDFNIDEKFINRLHAISVQGLNREGSTSPGIFRDSPVAISQSKHVPPAAGIVPSMMKDLVEFANKTNMPQQDLLKTAVVHHRLAWIHPYDNGNGRVTRLVTYAMLVKQGFIDDKGFHILNPTAVFCNDRQQYYDMLAVADDNSTEGIETWCEYVLLGIKAELLKVDQLLDVAFAREQIILPTLLLAREKGWLNLQEYEIMLIAFDKGLIQAGDVLHIFGTNASARVQASRVLYRLREQNYLTSHPENARKYYPRFFNNYLLRGVMAQLEKNNLLPIRDEVTS